MVHASTAASANREDARRLVTALFTVVRRATHLRREHLPDPIDRATMGLLFFTAKHQPLRVSDLAGELQLDPSTVSRQVRTLTEAGYIQVSEDPDDRRARNLRITDAGRQIIRDHLDTLAEAIDDALAGWTDADRAQLSALMTRLADDLGPADCPTPPHPRTESPA